jgi:hypothetical protein
MIVPLAEIRRPGQRRPRRGGRVFSSARGHRSARRRAGGVHECESGRIVKAAHDPQQTVKNLTSESEPGGARPVKR